MNAIAGTVTGFRSMADGTLQLRINMNEQESKQAMKLLCDVGASVAIARLIDPDGAGHEQEEGPDTTDAPAHAAPYGQQAKALRLSGFFRSPHVWNCIGDDRWFRDWVRDQKSCLDGTQDLIDEDSETYKCEAAHVRRAGESGTGYKADFACVPLTHSQHRMQHEKGELAVLRHYRPQDNIQSVEDAKAWFDAARIRTVEQWGWECLKIILAQSGAKNRKHWNCIPPDVLLDWAQKNGVEQYLPGCYRA